MTQAASPPDADPDADPDAEPDARPPTNAASRAGARSDDTGTDHGPDDDPGPGPRPDGVVESRRAQGPTDLQPEVLLDVAFDVQHDLVRNQTALLAAGIAFRAFLALFPVVIVAVTATALFRPGEDIEFTARRVMAGLPARGRELIMSQIDSIVQSDVNSLRFTLVVAFALAVWTAASALQGTITALTATQGEVDDRNWLQQRVLALKLAAASVPFVVVSISLITGVPWILRRAGLGSIVQVIGIVTTLVVLSLMMVSALAVLYRYGPDRRRAKKRWVTPGAIVATGLWVSGSEVLKVGTESVRGYDARYGVAAGVVILMFWLWLTAWCVLFGATFNARLEHQTLVDTTDGPPRPVGERDAAPADSHPERPVLIDAPRPGD